MSATNGTLTISIGRERNGDHMGRFDWDNFRHLTMGVFDTEPDYIGTGYSQWGETHEETATFMWFDRAPLTGLERAKLGSIADLFNQDAIAASFAVPEFVTPTPGL